MRNVLKRRLSVLLLAGGLGVSTACVDSPVEHSVVTDSGATGGSAGTGGSGGSSSDQPLAVTLSGKPVYYRFVRLTHEQWENSVRDVLKLPERTGLSSGFVPDPPEGKFENNERALYVGANLRTDYQRT